MNAEELIKLKEEVDLDDSNPVNGLFAVMDESSEYAGQNVLTSDKNRILGREK
jgi:hypothetical protein